MSPGNLSPPFPSGPRLPGDMLPVQAQFLGRASPGSQSITILVWAVSQRLAFIDRESTYSVAAVPRRRDSVATRPFPPICLIPYVCSLLAAGNWTSRKHLALSAVLCRIALLLAMPPAP